MKSYTWLDIVFIPIRTVVIIVLLPIPLLAGLLSVLGDLGDKLSDASLDLSRTITMHLNPRAWQLLKDTTDERDRLKSNNAFLNSRVEWLEKQKDTSTETPL